MIKNILKLSIIGSILASSLIAKDVAFTTGANISTLGAGLEATVRVNDYLAVRANANYFAFDHDDKIDDINYEGELDMQNFGLLADIYPFPESAFHLSVGAYFNNNDVTGKGTTTGTYKIGDTNYTGAEVGTLTADVEVGDISPYVGFGWDTTANNNESGFGFVFNAGVMYTGKPEVSLSSTGAISSNATFQADLAKEKREFENDIDDFQFYPVLSIGLNYRF
jgi:hypothetical protein